MSTQMIETATSPSNSHHIDEFSSSMLGKIEALAIIAVDSVLDFLQSQNERATLVQLSDRELRDIGLSRSAIGGAEEPRGPIN